MAKPVLVLSLLVLFSGCDFLGRHSGVAHGNFEFSQGRFSEALRRYEGVLDLRIDADSERLVEFNIGSVRYAIGDVESAADHWTASSDTEQGDVRFRSVYNLGVLLFQQGRYRAAFEQFREALRLQPSDLESKHNLELAFNRWQATGPEQAETVLDATESLPPAAEGSLDEIRRRSAERFRVREEPIPWSDVNDW